MSKSPDESSLEISPRFTDRLVRALARHPYLCTLAVCLGIDPFYLGSIYNVPPNAMYIEVFMVFAAAFWIIHRISRKKALGKGITVLSAVVVSLLICAATLMYSRSEYKGLWMFVGGVLIMLLLYRFAKTDKYNEQLMSLLIMGIGFMLKFYYVFYSSCYTRQNDVHEFGGPNGHAAYMEYLLFNHKLPDFDVRTVWQFCHPPLHHIISALWIGVNEFVLGVGHNPARESLQTLSLFYSMTIMITSYRIFRHFRLKGLALYVPLGIVCFHPCFILFSGAINNDVLSVAFMIGAFLCTLRWYKRPELKEILKIALCVGLGMMTKLSAALVAPPIALVFLIVFIKRFKSDGKRLFGQFALFGLVCVPLGLWFEIKNYIKFRVPITYVQEMSRDSIQYIGDQRFLDRITDFSPKQFSSVFEQWLGPDADYNEHNPLIALLKNSLYSESIREKTFHYQPFYLSMARAFFWLAALLAAVCLVMMIFNIVTKSGLDPVQKLFWASFYVMLVGNFYKMALDYPFTCTLNFRYITPTVIVGVFFAGISVRRMQDSGKEKALMLSKLMAFAVFIFAVFSTLLYVQICLPEPQPAA